MIARGRGGVVNVSSVAGFLPGRGGTYGADKAWVTSFTEALAALARRHGRAGDGAVPRVRPHRVPRAGPHRRGESHGPDVAAAQRVVDEGLADLARGKVVSVPSRQYKALSTLVDVLPRPLLRGLVRRFEPMTGVEDDRGALAALVRELGVVHERVTLSSGARVRLLRRHAPRHPRPPRGAVDRTAHARAHGRLDLRRGRRPHARRRPDRRRRPARRRERGRRSAGRRVRRPQGHQAARHAEVDRGTGRRGPRRARRRGHVDDRRLRCSRPCTRSARRGPRSSAWRPSWTARPAPRRPSRPKGCPTVRCSDWLISDWADQPIALWKQPRNRFGSSLVHGAWRILGGHGTITRGRADGGRARAMASPHSPLG